MAKSALSGLTRGLARALGPHGITAARPDRHRHEPRERDSRLVPPQRHSRRHYGRVKDVAALVSYLAGEGGRYITRTAITTGGGLAA